jgi:hypothetical protein
MPEEKAAATCAARPLDSICEDSAGASRAYKWI